MDTAALHTLLAPDALRLLDALGVLRSDADAARAVDRLRRAGHSPQLVSAIVDQARLRSRAAAKFASFADRMLFTSAGLEQATRLEVAAHHAGRMRTADVGLVADLGCGIGGDALAFAAAGLRVRAVEADEVTAAMAAFNLAVFGDVVDVVHGRAEASDIADADALWLDPARRTDGHRDTRRVRPDDYSPALTWAFAQSARRPTGIKLGPGHDRDGLPTDAETQWVSVDGTVVELVVWTGALARPGVRRAALVLRGGHAHELTAASDTADAPVRGLGAFVHEPDGAVIRARLIGDVARRLGGGMLDPRIAYITGDDAVTDPLVRSFRVRQAVPARPRDIQRMLRGTDIGTLEIKKRGVDVDPQALRRALRLRGPGHAVLILTRVGSRHVAILADRVEATGDTVAEARADHS